MYNLLIETDCSKKLEKEFDKEIREQIKKSLEKLKTYPYHNTFHLKGEFQGKRKLRSGKMRIIFSICEECRKLGYKQFNNCGGCEKEKKKTL